MRKITILSTLFLLTLTVFNKVHGNDSLEVRNAYYLAKSLSSVFDHNNNLVPKDTKEYTKLLSAIHYYAYRIDSTESEAQVSSKLNNNPVLSGMLLKLSDAIHSNTKTQLFWNLTNQYLINPNFNLKEAIEKDNLWENFDSDGIRGILIKSAVIKLTEEIKQISDEIEKLQKGILVDSLYDNNLLQDTSKLRKLTPIRKFNIDTLKKILDSWNYNKLSINTKKIVNLISLKKELTKFKDSINTLSKIPSILVTQEDFLIFKEYTNITEDINDSAKSLLSEDHFTLIEDFKKALTPQIIQKLDKAEIQLTQQMHHAETQASIMINTMPAQLTNPLTLGLPSESEMIDAVAMYLVKRVKQESVMWFFEQLKKRMRDDSLSHELFSHTLRLLASNEVYEVPNLGATWQYALSKDIVGLPENLFKSKWLESRAKGKLGNAMPYIELGIKMGSLINQHMSINDIITQLHISYIGSKDTSHQYLTSTIHLLYGITRECFIIKGDTFSSMMNYQNIASMDERSFRIMLELINLRYGNAFTNLGINIAELNLLDYKKWLGTLMIDYDQLQKVKLVIEKEQGKEQPYRDYNVWYTFQKFLTDLVPPLAQSNKVAQYRSGMELLRSTQNIFNAANHKNYYGMVDECIKIVDTLIAQKIPNGKDIITELASKKLQEELFENHEFFTISTKKHRKRNRKIYVHVYDSIDEKKDSLRRISFSIRAFKKRSELIPEDTFYVWKQNPLVLDTNILSYFNGDSLYINKQTALTSFYESSYYTEPLKKLKELISFFGDVASAKGAPELSQVIEKYAMPPTSYKRKRNVWYSIDVNAFVGGYIGYEKVQKTDVTNSMNIGNLKAIWGLSAPIGVTFSKSFGRSISLSNEIRDGDLRIKKDKLRFRKMTPWHVSVTVSLVDIGAVVSYRFQSSDSTLPQKVKWSQLVSPGIHLGLAIPGTPLCFKTGAQFNPELRRFIDEDRQYGAFRFYTGVFFDLPIYNLYYKREGNKKIKQKTRG